MSRQGHLNQTTQWKGHHAFACAALLVILSLAINEGLRASYGNIPAFADWVRDHSYITQSVVMSVRGGLWLLTALLCSRPRSIRPFLHAAGLTQRFTLLGWLVSWLAVAIAVADLYVVGRGWSSSNQPAPSFLRTGKAAWGFFVLYTAIWSPFVEEVVMRGFLYRAFRGSYQPTLSTVLVICLQSYFHWGLVSTDVPALLFFAIGGITLCLIREFTGSAWNCVLFHAAYNATVIRQWPLCLAGMIVVLAFCARSGKLAPLRKAERFDPTSSAEEGRISSG